MALILSICLLYACKHQPAVVPAPEVGGADRFPADVSQVIRTRCATAGCHNKASYEVSGGGLLMDTWEHLFEGGNHGAAAVAYSPENSPLLFFTNTYPEYGTVATDLMRMPYNGTPLTREEYLTLQRWITAGAPDIDGNIPFASDPDTRQKIYVAHQGCDYVNVIDAEKQVVMRCIPIGREFTIETAYSLKLAPDGRYAYLSFWNSQYLQRIDTRTDTVTGQVDMGNANSNLLYPTPDNKSLLVSNWFLNAVVSVNTGQMLPGQVYQGSPFTAPHGIAANASSDTFLVTERFGNTVYRVAGAGSYQKISIDGNPLTTQSGNTPDPYNILMSNDHSKYFLTCENSAEVRVMDANSDALMKVLSVGKKPQEMALSRTRPYLFVSCMEDSSSLPLSKGSVYVIDYNTLEVVKKIEGRFYLPHAIAVDDRYGRIYIFSRNLDQSGPPPHHNSSACSGRIGFYSVYDLNTLEPVNNKRYELSIDPFAADIRFK